MFLSFNDLGILGWATRLALLAAASTYPESCQLDFNQLQQNNSNGTASSAQTASNASVSRSANTDTCASLIDGPPRGLACLQCMHPRAREQADQIISVLRRSCVKNIAINYLVDGTFSFDESLLHDHIAMLTENKRQLFLHLYLTNGPAQRRGGSNSESVYGVTYEPEEFRAEILNNSSLQAGFQRLVERLIPVLRDAQEHGVQVAIVPMLEDNLDKESFDKMAHLVFDALPSDISVAIGRNPCPGCGTGSDDDRPAGVFLESHSIRDAWKLTNAFITNDGDDYSLSGGNGLLSIQEIREARAEAESRNSVFVLWSAGRQGFTVDERGKLERKPVNERNYALISSDEQNMLIDLLRDGLAMPAN